VHHLVSEVADVVAHQDVVQDLGHILEIVGVLLIRRQAAYFAGVSCKYTTPLS
jgi:hypothetical protein